MKSHNALVLAMALNTCTPTTGGDVSRLMTVSDSTLPPIKMFSSGRQTNPIRANNDLAQDFIELSFKLESGREVGACGPCAKLMD